MQSNFLLQNTRSCNKVVYELCVMQFWSEIVLFKTKLAKHTCLILKSRIGFQTKLHSTQFNSIINYAQADP